MLKFFEAWLGNDQKPCRGYASDAKSKDDLPLTSPIHPTLKIFHDETAFLSCDRDPSDD